MGVNGRGDEFLASTGLAFDQDRRICRSDRSDQLKNFQQAGAISDDSIKAVDLTVGTLVLELFECAIIRKRYYMTSHKTVVLDQTAPFRDSNSIPSQASAPWVKKSVEISPIPDLKGPIVGVGQDLNVEFQVSDVKKGGIHDNDRHRRSNLDHA
jgi:hypothetical protein